MTRYNGFKGNTYTLGRELGRGGEGAVYEINEDPNLVLKLYTESPDKDKAEKLIFMSSIQDAELIKIAAWPIDIIKDANANICGLTMKKLEGFYPLHMLFSPMDRKKTFSDKGYDFLIHVARNLAGAFSKLHKAGIVMGDVNEANILVNPNGIISLIDCDSFQIKNGNKYHFCEVGIPRYTPPELLDKGTFQQTIRTSNTDNFSLAVLIFQLLFMGRSPFVGISNSNEDIDEEKAIRTKLFAYSIRNNNKKLSPAKNSFDIQYLTPGIISLLHTSFENEIARPTAESWIQELTALLKTMAICEKSKLHFYMKGLSHCPWCQFKEKSGILYFIEDTYLKDLPLLNNINEFINGFKVEKIELKDLSKLYINGNCISYPVDQKFKNMRYFHLGILALVIILTLILWTQSPVYPVLGIICFIYLYHLSPPIKKLNQELSDQKRKLQNLRSSLDTLKNNYKSSQEIILYNDLANRTAMLINQYKGIPEEFKNGRKSIEEKCFTYQYNIFLQKFDITKHKIPSFGPAKMQLLYNHGIRTAADISLLKNIKIIGIGTSNLNILLQWQRQIGTAFSYVPDQILLDRETNLLIKDMERKKKKLEQDIKSTYSNTVFSRSNILTKASNLEIAYKNLVQQIDQAEEGIKLFTKIAKLY
jgi:DNA-binding helix-hairpin-helix protein with protein kinase domain